MTEQQEYDDTWGEVAYSTHRGEHNGEQGTFYNVLERGGPDGSPYAVDYFVSDGIAKALGARHDPSQPPWREAGAVRIDNSWLS